MEIRAGGVEERESGTEVMGQHKIRKDSGLAPG
jgi:hypothetical protein